MAAVWLGVAAVGQAASDPRVRFTDVTAAAGIEFVQTIGDDHMSNIVEATGVGCGFLDYDNDGQLDIYFVNGCWTAGVSNPKLNAERRTALAAGATDRLYRNRGDGTFEDVTAAAGLARPAYGLAVLAADYDGDGDQDIYVTNLGPNFLYRNNGDGTFTDVAQSAGVADPDFGIGAAFLDYNHDGRLDLYVGNYLTYDPSRTPEHARDIVRSPLAYEGQQDRLFRGNPDGTFADVTEKAGLKVQPVGRAMGVGALDYDGDGWLDVFVANDAMENFLFHNQGAGSFENVALLAGVAFSEAGAAAAAMAVEIGDYDRDGRPDILVPDMNRGCLYHNLGGGLFEDVAVRSGIAAAVCRVDSWGGVLADLNLDGRLDAYIANGHAASLEPQGNVLLLGGPRGRFIAVAVADNDALALKRASRGVARGDYDNDGDIDLLVANLNAPPTLLRNDTPRGGRHWLGVRLVGRPPNRDAIGAVVRIEAGDLRLMQARLSAGGYLSQHDARLHFGLGKHSRVGRLTVTWPDGTQQTLTDLPVDQFVRVRQVTK